MMNKVNIAKKLEQIHDQWNPRIAGELNGQQVRLVKIQGDQFELHKHEDEDELFMVINGSIQLELKESLIDLKEGEFFIVPKGTLHRPIAEKEAQLMIFTAATNINTGDVQNEFTLNTTALEKI